MGTHREVAVEVFVGCNLLWRVGLAIVCRHVLLTELIGQRRSGGVVPSRGRDVVLLNLGVEHPHKGYTLLHLREVVVRRDVVREGRVERGVTYAYILRIRHIEDILQLRNRRVVGPRAEEYAQGVLAVEGEVCHRKVHKVVVALVDLVALLAYDMSIQLGTLVREVYNHTVLALRETESRTNAVCPETAGKLLCHIRVLHHITPTIVGVEGVFIIALVLKSHTILQRKLCRLADRLVVGEASTHGILLVRTVDVLVERSVEERAIHHILPRCTLAKVFVVLGGVVRVGIRDTIRLVRCGALLALVVLIVETTIHGERSARLAELGANLKELVEVECLLLAPTI